MPSMEDDTNMTSAFLFLKKVRTFFVRTTNMNTNILEISNSIIFLNNKAKCPMPGLNVFHVVFFHTEIHHPLLPIEIKVCKS